MIDADSKSEHDCATPVGALVAYVGPFDFPEGDASSRRVLGVVSSLVRAGYRVVVLPGGASNGDIGPLAQDVSVIPQYETKLRRRKWARALHALFLLGADTIRTLQAMEEKPRVIVVYGGNASIAIRVLRWARQNGVRAIVDIVEWYEPSHMPLGRMGPFAVSFYLAFNYLYKRFDGAIVISRLLQRRFSQWLPCVLVPPTTETYGSPKVRKGEVLRLVYAGTPGKKDLLGIILDAVSLLAASGVKVFLDVVGVRDDQLDQLAVREVNRSAVRAWGRLPRNDVLEIVRAADFSILARKKARFSDAGFPTKFVESCSLATPVIANITSDLGDYLIDGENGLVFSLPTVDSIASAILRASEITGDAYLAMSASASRLCRESFHPNSFAESVSSHMDLVLGVKRSDAG